MGERLAMNKSTRSPDFEHIDDDDEDGDAVDDDDRPTATLHANIVYRAWWLFGVWCAKHVSQLRRQDSLGPKPVNNRLVRDSKNGCG